MAADRSEMSDGLYMTVEQYFALDESSDAKYEYLDGYAFLLRPPSSDYDDQAFVNMAGGRVAHGALCARMVSLLDQALGIENPCMVYSSDTRLRLQEHRYFYPDVTVSCGEQQDALMLTNPIVVVEVLSPGTEKRDRGEKFKAYKAMPSLQEYVLIGSKYKTIEIYRREGNFWRQYSYYEGDTIELTSIGVRFSFDAVYRRIPL